MPTKKEVDDLRQQAKDLEDKAPELPAPLSVINADLAEQVAAIANDPEIAVGDVYLNHPSITEMMRLFASGSPGAADLIQAYVRREDNKKIFTPALLEKVPGMKLLDLHAEISVHFCILIKMYKKSASLKKTIAATLIHTTSSN